MTSLESIAQHIKESQDSISKMSEGEVVAYRKLLLKINHGCLEAVSKTSTKEHIYDDCKVVEYINQVLEDGFNLIRTGPSSFPDAQHLKRFKPLIKGCVEHSSFSKSSFKIKHLRYQRSAIEQSNTLHELRQNINAMIGPLRMHNEQASIDALNNTIDDDFISELITVDDLLSENEQLKGLLKERDRVISEIMNIYDEPLKEQKDKIDLLQSIDSFKVAHNATDGQACKVFNVSRSAITRLRKEFIQKVKS